MTNSRLIMCAEAFGYFGQNIAWQASTNLQTPNWVSAIAGWYDEVKVFDKNQVSKVT